MRNSNGLLLLAGLLAAPAVTARSIPSNVLSFYNSIRSQGTCKNMLKSGFYSKENDSRNFGYCGDHLSDYGIVYLQGPGGQLVNMDIDCDGQLSGGNGDCGSSQDTQGQTSFVDTLKGYKAGVSDLNAYVHSYVVFGNEGSKPGYATFHPQSYGIEPLSVMAVVCNGKMFYGVWGDENGDDGPSLVGEASISLGQACFGRSVNGNSGYDNNDVLFLAFTGSSAVPGAKGAKWNAKSFTEFEASLATVGDKLVSRIGSKGSPSPGSTPSTCSWAGHCAGAACGSDADCSDSLTCKSRKCA